jgi:ferredoxin-type protein NapH
MQLTRKTLRRMSQLTVLGLFAVVPWLNIKEIYVISGNLLSSEVAGVPLADPLAALQVLASNREIAGTLLFGALLVMLLAVFLGPVFCSWLCPYGFIADMLHKFRPSKKYRKLPSGLAIKAVVIGLAILAIGALETPPVLNQLSLPGWYTRTMQSLWFSGTIPAGFWLIPAAMALDVLSGERIWCRYLCPQSLLLVLAGKILPNRFRVMYNQESCLNPAKNVSPCQASCPLGIDPRTRHVNPECTNCGDCVVTCAKYGKALSQKVAQCKK